MFRFLLKVIVKDHKHSLENYDGRDTNDQSYKHAQRKSYRNQNLFPNIDKIEFKASIAYFGHGVPAFSRFLSKNSNTIA